MTADKAEALAQRAYGNRVASGGTGRLMLGPHLPGFANLVHLADERGGAHRRRFKINTGAATEYLDARLVLISGDPALEDRRPYRQIRDGRELTDNLSPMEVPAGAAVIWHEGLRGDTGPKGDKGEDGARGQRGLRGLRGLQGLPGTNGTDGEDGQQGPRGSKGDKGDRGAPGRDGTDGRNGEDGRDGLGQPLVDARIRALMATLVAPWAARDNDTPLPLGKLSAVYPLEPLRPAYTENKEAEDIGPGQINWGHDSSTGLIAILYRPANDFERATVRLQVAKGAVLRLRGARYSFSAMITEAGFARGFLTATARLLDGILFSQSATLDLRLEFDPSATAVEPWALRGDTSRMPADKIDGLDALIEARVRALLAQTGQGG